MNDRLRFAAFGGGLVVLFGAALGIGSLVGDRSGAASGPATPDHGQHETAAATGLTDSLSGYTLGEVTAPATPNQQGALQFRITGPQGTVTQYNNLHDKDLHLIVVRTDASQFRHVHPAKAPDGTWSIDWKWAAPGSYRVFADFSPVGGPGEIVLSRTVAVAGNVTDKPLPPVSRTANVDGYQVTLKGDLTTAGSELTFDVTRDGKPVTDLQPYLGAYAHLVALRATDLAYLHVHPEGEVGKTAPGPDVVFAAQAPSDGNYRLYLDFQHGGAVHTAEFTQTATAAADSDAPAHHEGGHS
ncbi:hypothetical protein [Nocardia seriolae]|uniref:Heavy metal-binding domain-containing protein n=1 Tax=Nocardia seriolae TaxID=37332 RepID=A0ABC8ANF5_9NOCA|nr:hypothetical protein [Nocardia seriolae]APA95711.1 hypothetical protein NS506_01641 [Nocardia seriolae]OJF82829.1 hypothetical protein NS14008_31475 [Nocardia seriolae]PSK26879.1 hypothetical protein C6575_34875 [Nocardia seriolae]QOW33585.1 hypothetical protein IMZ23_38625 [Nocardia seriolae]QUN20662.1 hypothetical protein KEC46_16190 [Nocardia seriolae]